MTYTTERLASPVNTRRGYTLYLNNGKLIARFNDKPAAYAAMQKYGGTRCYIQYFLLRPIDFMYDAYRQFRALGFTPKEAVKAIRDKKQVKI